MHEVLFRGKRADNGDWVYGYLIHDKYCNVQFPYIGYLTIDGVEVVEVLPETVGQYTGFTANGIKIFDGDICKSLDGVFVVGWNKDKCAFVMNFFDYPNEVLYMEEMLDDTEVIGNVFDNDEPMGE